MKFDDMPWERGAPAWHEPKAQRMFRIGGQAIIRVYNAATDEEKLAAAASLSEILRQIDEG
ncbi:hypothetical protein [Chlorobaculum sp. 24CR]|uniref:hypothetical protein n=1 Tax=Chlorobaculum sp. 24CR TaxID=2508878 RepID=UPI0014308B6A|nr:hypothetical protein [Chlorobaculum sp. 24CR]